MSPIDKDTMFNGIAIFAAWLIVIVACVNPAQEEARSVVRIAYAGD